MFLLRNGSSLTTPSQNSTPGSQKTNLQRVRTNSPLRKWNPLSESSRTSSSRRKNLSKACKNYIKICVVCNVGAKFNVALILFPTISYLLQQGHITDLRLIIV